MRAGLIRICLICLVALATAYAVAPQNRRRRPAQSKPAIALPTPTPEVSEPSPEPTPPPEDENPEVVKVRTDLVSFPVIATTIDGTYVTDLTKEEFKITEDDAKQEVAFFATTTAPFNVVLLLDTSASTQEKLGLIRRSAIAFVEQLQPGDRVKVISFDNKITDLNEFTNNRDLLRSAINKTSPGTGTKLYDAIELALSSLKSIQGRKAIVLFSDGVDYHSDMSTYEGTLHWLDEEGAVVYAIQYNTRPETERLAREQANDTSALPTIDVIRAPPSGTTAPTFPGDDPNTVPTVGRRPSSGPMGLPSASEILRQRRDQEREREARREGGSLPPRGTIPETPRRDTRYPRDEDTSTRPTRDTRSEDESIKAMLDLLYLKADSYMKELTEKSGGRIVKADTLSSLPDAFSKIAAELRTQYAIGYYPTNKERDGKYRKIKVSTSRKDVKLRSRPGYRAPIGG